MATEMIDGVRNRVGRLVVLGGFAVALGVGLGIGLGPEQADARVKKEIVEGPEGCDPNAFPIPGVVVVCRDDDDAGFPWL